MWVAIYTGGACSMNTSVAIHPIHCSQVVNASHPTSFKTAILFLLENFYRVEEWSLNDEANHYYLTGAAAAH